jgi:hypothetical protein
MGKLEGEYANQKIYRVLKIYDRKSGEAVNESRMCGQAAIPYVPSKEYQKWLATKDADRDAFSKWANDAKFDEIWERQEELEPIIGLPIYFSSVKMDAGWYRTSVVEKVERDGRTGDITLTTVGSKLLVREDD